MRLWMKMLAIALAACVLPVLTGHIGIPARAEAAELDTSGLWLYAVSAGKADALVVGSGKAAILVDAGYARSRGRILAALDRLGVERLEAAFLTHTDRDHEEGFDWIAQSDLKIGAWYASACYTGIKKETKHPMVAAAAQRGQTVNWLSAGDGMTIGDMRIEVLAPFDLSDNENDNSLVLKVTTGEGTILLMGDVEFEGEIPLLASGADLSCDLLKIPNHADDDAASEALLRAANASMAVICTDSYEKPGTPDPRILSALSAMGCEAHVTQQTTGGCFFSIHDGAVSERDVNLPTADASLALTKVVPGEDTISIQNTGADVRLDGMMLYSSRGGEWYVFPEDVVLPAGGTLVVGTRTTKQSNFDLLWDDKKVVHPSKPDVVTLYDTNGQPLASADNGL